MHAFGRILIPCVKNDQTITCNSAYNRLNDIIHRALSAAKTPARLEPSGVARSDGIRPVGISMVPVKEGKVIVWDATSETPWHHHISRLLKESRFGSSGD